MSGPSKKYRRAAPEYDRQMALARDRKQILHDQLIVPYQRRAVLVQLGIFVLVMVLWPLPIVNPIKLLVVLIHEMSHVTAAYLTGGKVYGLAIDPAGAGVTLGVDGIRWIILLAGYIGSFSIGALIYYLSAKWSPMEVWLCLCALCLASLTMGWLNSFTATFAWVSFLLILFVVGSLRENWQKFGLRVLATTSCLYPLLDMLGEALRPERHEVRVGKYLAGSDVSQLAQMFYFPKLAMGGLCCLIGLGIVLWLSDWVVRNEAEADLRKSVLDHMRRKDISRRRPRDPIYDPNDSTTVRVYRLR